jgi:enoyl-CoA hydratase/carnithine racemase
MESGSNHISVESDARIMWIRFCRPKAMNALSSAMLDVITEAIDLAARDDEVRCVVFIGEGKAFCAGADLSAVPEGSDGLAAFVAKASATMSRIELLEKPVIACLNGLTLAGGLELALCADIVVAAASAQIGDGHVNFGFLPGAGGSVRLARAIGPGRARFLLYSGQRMSATDMERWGLVQQVFEDSELYDQVAVLAARIAEHSPLVLRRLKALVASSLGGGIASLLAEELAANVAHAGSYDMREGRAAFAEKRKPVFLGR